MWEGSGGGGSCNEVGERGGTIYHTNIYKTHFLYFTGKLTNNNNNKILILDNQQVNSSENMI